MLACDSRRCWNSFTVWVGLEIMGECTVHFFLFLLQWFCSWITIYQQSLVILRNYVYFLSQSWCPDLETRFASPKRGFPFLAHLIRDNPHGIRGSFNGTKRCFTSSVGANLPCSFFLTNGIPSFISLEVFLGLALTLQTRYDFSVVAVRRLHLSNFRFHLILSQVLPLPRTHRARLTICCLHIPPFSTHSGSRHCVSWHAVVLRLRYLGFVHCQPSHPRRVRHGNHRLGSCRLFFQTKLVCALSFST
jgi:hypothetical protein